MVMESGFAPFSPQTLSSKIRPFADVLCFAAPCQGAAKCRADVELVDGLTLVCGGSTSVMCAGVGAADCRSRGGVL